MGRKQRSGYVATMYVVSQYITQSMYKVICPMDEYDESRTFESTYGKRGKKWPVHIADVSVCGKLEAPTV